MIEISGNIKVAPNNDTFIIQNSKIVIDSTALSLTGNSTLMAASVLAHTKQGMVLQQGYNITSLVKNTCSKQNDTSYVFSCVPFKTLQTDISE